MSRLSIGIMSGTSLDGADAALVDWPDGHVLAFLGLPFDEELRAGLAALCTPGPDEVDRMGLAGCTLARHYAQVVKALLAQARVEAGSVAAIGCHGQTIRHRPQAGYTVQLQNPALLAELTGITVAADFRSRDMAAGGQGAPLAPAFHEAVFGVAGERRAVVNIGGISNATVLDGTTCVTGFDCGPGNVLLDHWAGLHLGTAFDAGGAFAARGSVDESLLRQLLSEPYFQRPPPKSTGRELFHALWLEKHLAGRDRAAADVAATLSELTVCGIRDSLRPYGQIDRILVCGGGAHNDDLMRRLSARMGCPVDRTDAAGIPATQVEAVAFSWLADGLLQGRRLTLGHITGSRHPIPLGAIYPA